MGGVSESGSNNTLGFVYCVQGRITTENKGLRPLEAWRTVIDLHLQPPRAGKRWSLH